MMGPFGFHVRICSIFDSGGKRENEGHALRIHMHHREKALPLSGNDKWSALHLFICCLSPFLSTFFSLPLSFFHFLLLTHHFLYTQMPLVHGSYFAINLESDHIILHGTPEESAGVILRGSVVLNCNEATKIKSLTLKLEGKTKVNWTEGIYHSYFVYVPLTKWLISCIIRTRITPAPLQTWKDYHRTQLDIHWIKT